MSVKDVVEGVLMGTGVLLIVLCCIGVLVMRSAYAKLHFLGPVSLGVALIAIALLIDRPAVQSSAKAIFLAIFVLVSNPVLSHATARAVKTREDRGLNEAGRGGERW